MAITGVNNYTTYANYYTQTKPKDSSENAKNPTEQQTAEKTHSNTREYRNYLLVLNNKKSHLQCHK